MISFRDIYLCALWNSFLSIYTDDSSTTPPPAPTACQPTEYYNQTAGRCEACFCNGFERTTAPLQCDPITGSCICRDEGRRGGPGCDRCIWELRGENCDMCKEGMRIKNNQGPETCRMWTLTLTMAHFNNMHIFQV